MVFNERLTLPEATFLIGTIQWGVNDLLVLSGAPARNQHSSFEGAEIDIGVLEKARGAT